MAIPDDRHCFILETSGYRLLRARSLITSRAQIIMKATDFTYLKMTEWGWFYLSPILDDFAVSPYLKDREDGQQS